jgi:NAD(P)-dependent dehydrogenase (short-subunit alcohol dehydrogenase family)
VVLADLGGRSAEEAAAEVGSACTVRRVDVSRREEVEALVAETRASFGRIDLMVNNAGMGLDGEFQDMRLDQWERVVEVNLWGVVYGTHYAYPVMIEQGFGQIVNVASLAGLMPGGLMTSYVAAKHAVVGLTLGLRAEARQYGIKVNALCPGFIETPIHDRTEKVSAYLAAAEEKRRRSGKRRRFPTADRCIRGIMRGIERNRAVIVSPRRHRPYWWLYRLAPALVPWAWSKIIARLKR